MLLRALRRLYATPGTDAASMSRHSLPTEIMIYILRYGSRDLPVMLEASEDAAERC